MDDLAPNELRFDRYTATRWTDLEESGLLGARAERWRDRIREMEVGSGDRFSAEPVPDALQADLRSYQREGLDWLRERFDHGLGGILADDMGLGKTLQMLGLVAHARSRTPAGPPLLVVAPRLTNPVFAEILRGVDDELTRSGYGIIIGNLDNRREREARYVDLALSRQVDGVLLLTGYIPENGTRDMRESGLPIVAMCAAIDDDTIPNVVVQDREAARRAVEYLAGLGHRRFGYISGTPTSIIEHERFRGFQEGIAAAGFSQDDFVRWEGGFVFSTGVSAAESFLKMQDRPTGIFAACDEGEQSP